MKSPVLGLLFMHRLCARSVKFSAIAAKKCVCPEFEPEPLLPENSRMQEYAKRLLTLTLSTELL
jgi:hypothetical protein